MAGSAAYELAITRPPGDRLRYQLTQAAPNALVTERLDAFMARANAMYYATRDPFGDFTTSPEITQVFGELLGLWAAVVWQSMGAPSPVVLAEAGPGRGTLIADALRAIRQTAPDFRAALSVHLVEASARLRALQSAAVSEAIWHERFETLPQAPLLLIANEFLDALPIRQFVRRGETWHERHVAGGAFVEHPCAGPPSLPREAQDGAVIEYGEVGEAVVRALAHRVTRHGGAALLIDYGPAESTPGDSLQALANGQPADPLAAPGTADLTAHVDFAALATAARAAGATVYGPLPQGIFLTRVGLFQRTDRLARTLQPARAMAMIESARRLAEPDRMGRLFKAMAICHPAVSIPPGFSE